MYRQVSQLAFAAVLCGCLVWAVSASAEKTLTPVHGLAIHGDLKYGADFKNLDYVNPDAPKGGRLRLAVAGGFDNLNPYIVKGQAAPGMGQVFQTLLDGTLDEPFSEYGQIAMTVEMPEDRSFVVFNLNPAARWHDGKPLTAEDVVWTFDTLMKDGHPFYRAYYTHVTQAVAETAHRVRFVFDMAGNRELPLIMGQMPVLPKHYWAGKDFSATTLEAPLGSGPYRVASVTAGRRIVFERVKDWWAADVPVNRGRYNFDEISYDMYLDESVLLQALFAGEYDLRQENIAKAWEGEYNARPVRDGLIVKAEIPHNLPAGMQGFVFNTRRTVFADARVRQALGYAFDFEWSNAQFAHGSYKRTNSYFENSEMASGGLPQGRELEILEAFRDRLDPRVFTTPFENPVTDGSRQGVRENLRKAKALLEEAGWVMGKNGLLEKDGQSFRFEFLLQSPAFERWVAPFIANLKRLGIEGRIRLVDTAQYQNRMDRFDFDMAVGTFGQSLNPGNEQRDFWGAEKADVQGSRNIIGVRDPVVDALIGMIIDAPDREELVHRTRALDRVLLSGYYVIPNWHINYFRVAYWDVFGQPQTRPKYGLGIADTWWFDAAKAARVSALNAGRRERKP